MCANWGAVYDGMIGYRQRLDDDLQARSNMITEASEEFLEKMSKQDVGSGMRVLYLKNVQDAAQWVRNTYISFEASPVSVLFGGIGEAVSYTHLSQGLSPTYEQAHVGSDLLTLASIK